ncbi:MAG: hypothetical protein EBZ75_08560 [Oxalobacteraceae bacterium]|nr:hypothetical protein [Oxalobacteraceae bacterium]
MDNLPNYSCMCPACLGQRPITERDPVSQQDAKRSYFTFQNGKILFSDTVSDSFTVANAKPVFTTDQIVQQLRTQWGGSPETFTFSWSPTSVINYSTPTTPLQNGVSELSGFSAVSAARKASVKEAFELWNDVVAPNFVEQTTASQNQIQVAWSSNTGNGTYAKVFQWVTANGSNSYSGTNYKMSRSEIWMATQWSTHDQDSDFFFGGYGPTTLLHEIGHAIGISHPGTYNAGTGNISYNASAEFKQDTRAYSLMSYFDVDADGSGTDHIGSDNVWKYAQTPMVYDIAAAQAIYGADTNTRKTDTTYGFNSTAGKSVFDFSQNTNPIVTIWDAGGSDALDVSGFSTNQYINLVGGMYSDVGAMTKNVSIAFNAVIENAVGGSGGDLILGNEVGNTLGGNSGNDLIFGAGGNDSINGGSGNQDAVGLLGIRGDYTITYSGGIFTATDKIANRDGTDRISNTELFYFLGSQETVQASEFQIETDSVTAVLASPRVDNNGDRKITSNDTGRGIQLVKLDTNAVALDFSGNATVGSTGSFLSLKLSTGANWVPPVTTSGAYLGVADVTGTSAADSWLVLERSGSGASTAYKGYKFNEKTDAAGVAVIASSTGQTISLTDLLKMETDNAVDFNGDLAIGDGVSQVIASPRMDDNQDGKITSADSSRGIQLVRLASGAVAIDMSGEATAGSSTDLLTLKLPTGAIWQPPVTTSGAYVGVFERISTDTLLVIERTGTGATATFKTYEFDADGENTGSATMVGTVAQTLSSAQLLSMESMMGVDFNGDTNVELEKLLLGTVGPDTLIGGVGSDTLIGAAGRDVLTGGLGWDTFYFGDLADTDSFTSVVTDVITDFVIGEDEVSLNLGGSYRLKTMGNYNNLRSFAKAADKLLDGSVKVVFGKVGADGYLFVDEDGTGISAIIQLTGLKECPSISTGVL